MVHPFPEWLLNLSDSIQDQYDDHFQRGETRVPQASVTKPSDALIR